MPKPIQKSEEHDKDFSAFQSPHEASLERLVVAIDRAYHRPWQLIWRAFLHGFMAAVGAFAGTAFIGIFSVYIIQALGGVSLLDSVIDKLQGAVEESVDKRLDPVTDSNE